MEIIHNEPQPGPKLSYYQLHKHEVSFKEYRNVWAKTYRQTHSEFRNWQNVYNRNYYQLNKEKLDKARKQYPDRTRNERVKQYLKTERENLSDNYIKKLITLSQKCKISEVSQEMIEEKRKSILVRREKNSVKKAQNT